MIPNMPPKLFSLSAICVGYMLINNSSSNEQNAMGNWLMLVAQVLSTNAFYKAVMQERGLDEAGKNNSFAFGQNENMDTKELLEKILNAINDELNRIKKDYNI